VNVKRPRVTEIAVTPNVVEKLLARRDAAGVFDEVFEQGKLFSR
jgi:hypothetical protein